MARPRPRSGRRTYPEGGARRRTGGGSRSQTSRPWPLHAPPPGGSVPAVAVGQRRRAERAVRPDRGRGALRSAAGRGGGAGRGERQLFVERPALPGPRRSSRGGRNPSVSNSGLMTRLIDASATGAREGPGGGGGYPENAAAFWPRGQEGRARRRTGGGSLSRTCRAWPLHRRRAGPSRPWATAARRGEPSVPAVDAVRRRGRLRDGAGARRAPARRGAPGTPRAASFEPRGTQPFRVR